MTETFSIRRQVEFNHCDAAGIVFYPRYFEMISSLTERFFSDALDFSWASIGLSEGYGTPMGNIEVRFHAPSQLEDWLDLSLQLERIGRSSATFLITCACEGAPRFTCKATVVYANIKTGGSEPWPETPRAKMSRYLTASSQNERQD
ncbi:acyl-CoA thioesterase [Celeribacter baekdonensis]|uniref:acyl-CoA thioesterase n=1 Tax=Celeribacter baekdonensis TaxID=875171 RepID=UPI003A8C9109